MGYEQAWHKQILEKCLHIGTALLTLETVLPCEHVQASQLGKWGHWEETQRRPSKTWHLIFLPRYRQPWVRSTQSGLNQRDFPDEPSALSAPQTDRMDCLEPLFWRWYMSLQVTLSKSELRLSPTHLKPPHLCWWHPSLSSCSTGLASFLLETSPSWPSVIRRCRGASLNQPNPCHASSLSDLIDVVPHWCCWRSPIRSPAPTFSSSVSPPPPPPLSHLNSRHHPIMVVRAWRLNTAYISLVCSAHLHRPQFTFQILPPSWFISVQQMGLTTAASGLLSQRNQTLDFWPGWGSACIPAT